MSGNNNNKKKDMQVGSSSSSLSNGPGHSSSSSNANAVKKRVKPAATQSVKSEEATKMMMMGKFRDLNLEGEYYLVEDEEDEMILNLTHEIKGLEKQVKERKEWAQQKAMEAARKLSKDVSELKMLRMERELMQRMMKQGESSSEVDPTVKRLSEMEIALRKASSEVDRANAAVRPLETENAEMRAEMEASKLSASESVKTCLEAARREKKRLKAWEKQRVKLQDDIAAVKHKIIEVQQEMVRVHAAKKTAQAKWKEEQKGKERAGAQVEEERRLKEATEVNNKRKQEALRSKIELDFQRHKDDLRRLEQELTRLKMPTNRDNKQSTTESTTESPDEAPNPTIARLIHELNNLVDFDENESGIDRECIICFKDEVSVVFLPCAHQLICAACNDEYGTKGEATCPICRVVIEQRVRVFGASS